MFVKLAGAVSRDDLLFSKKIFFLKSRATDALLLSVGHGNFRLRAHDYLKQNHRET